ncbi:MAG: NAD(P)-binding protein [Giesbergeria sp.]|nr:NAD(P)-binding protein [Giesbergeria sp.]
MTTTCAATSTSALKNIAIVGAGLAGLSCAQALSAGGQRVDVFEKSRGASGRMSTRRGDDAGQPWQCDHGAQYFTASDAAFRAEVARWQQAGAAALWSGQIASFDGQRWSTPSTDTERFVGTPRMTAPAACMVQSWGASAQLHLQTTVNRVQRGEGGWTLTSAEHGQHPTRYDALVLAVPAPQVLPLLVDASPTGHAIAASVRMRGSWALMLRCAARIDLPFDAAFVNAGPLRWLARDSSKPGRNGSEAGETWLLHAEAEWSEAHLEDDPASITAALLEAFVALGGSAEGITSTAHRWRYADTDPASTPASGNPQSWWDAQARLGLCGDWLHGGKVQGAWLSGQHVARRVLG